GVTDSDGDLAYAPDRKPGPANLADITATLTGTTPQDVLAAGRGYRELKDACADAIDAELAPIRKQHDELIADPAELRRTLLAGADKAAAVANRVLERART